MANVLNPETESITLNTELETPTLEPATELEQPSFESTSNPETAEVVENPVLDADTTTTELVSETEAEPTTEAVQQLPPPIEAHPEIAIPAQVEPEAESHVEPEAESHVEPEAESQVRESCSPCSQRAALCRSSARVG